VAQQALDVVSLEHKRAQLESATAVGANLNVDLERAFEKLSPGGDTASDAWQGTRCVNAWLLMIGQAQAVQRELVTSRLLRVHLRSALGESLGEGLTRLNGKAKRADLDLWRRCLWLGGR
jgi:hypothetical protein